MVGIIDWRVVFSSRATLERQRRIQRAEQRSSLVAPVVAVTRSVFSVFFPSDCKLCSLPLVNISRLPVCQDCLSALEPIRAPQCVQCGERLLPAQLLMGDGRCRGCYEFEPDFDRAVSFGEYAGTVRGLIHLLKYDNVMPAAPVLGRLLAEAVQQLRRGDNISQIETDATAALKKAGFDSVDYVAVRDAQTLEPVAASDKPARILAAAKIGRTRLLDNMPV